MTSDPVSNRLLTPENSAVDADLWNPHVPINLRENEGAL
jgi:hypothetical protein